MMIELRGAAQDLALSSQNTRDEKTRACLSKASLLKRLRLMIAKRKQRADLMKLDERLLRDIGKSIEEAEKEANRYFWQ